MTDFPPLTITSHIRSKGVHATGDALDIMITDFSDLDMSAKAKAQLYFDVFFTLSGLLIRPARFDLTWLPGCLHYHVQPDTQINLGIEINTKCKFESRKTLTREQIFKNADKYMRDHYEIHYKYTYLRELEIPMRFHKGIAEAPAIDTFKMYFAIEKDPEETAKKKSNNSKHAYRTRCYCGRIVKLFMPQHPHDNPKT